MPTRPSAARNFANRWITLRALLWLWTFRVGLAVVPFQRLLRFQERVRRPRRTPPHPSMVPRLARGVTRASRFCPGAKCLAEALAGQVLLGRAGFESELRIGVASGEPRLDAHAWLECQGHVVVGASEPGKYTTLDGLEGR
jgi:hypothetical protein